jgi:hypothetical protein
MATTTQETHDVLGTMIEQLTTMVATLQTINDDLCFIETSSALMIVSIFGNCTDSKFGNCN